ncbi:AMP-binding protein [Nostocoides sp.]|uniref:AMP-binding protein n=1 Tax=Nostocoides sp. TaxID=1917966 RepID=UPI002C02DB7A|nr:AMP-binding protein [Tetrasphaera sp.]
MTHPTLSHAVGERQPALLTDTIDANLQRTIARFGDRDAVVDCAAGVRLTYAAFGAEVDRLARALVAAGFRAGERVGIWAPNRVEWVIVQYATARAGLILVNINPAYRTHELEYVLKQAGISLLVTVEAFKTSNYRAMAEQVQGSCPDLRAVVYLGTASWTQLLDRATEVTTAQVQAVADAPKPDDPINIQYTSGTTGFPKGATLSHTNILNNGYFVGEICRYTEADRICIPVPFYHCFGMVMGNLAATSHGACMVIPAPAFDPAATLAAVQQERCTSLYGVPTMFIAQWALLEGEGGASYDLSTVRTGIMAGSPCPAELMKKLIAAGIEEMTICYGMTETSPVSTQTHPDDSFDHKVGTVGRVGPHLEIRVADPVTGETLPRGTSGEFCTKGYSVMLGYWQEPEKTADAVVDGWMRTGDLAVMDPDGYVRITGRIKDMVIRGGENIYPREIEEFLYTHPDIVDAQVIGVPDPTYGEEICAWVQLRPGAEPMTAQSLRHFCLGNLAHYKIPKYVRVVEEFPMTVTGKVRKVAMREESARELGLEG